eukprot:scaffold191582_cov16-Tisochrysis_lutea.AAC.2
MASELDRDYRKSRVKRLSGWSYAGILPFSQQTSSKLEQKRSAFNFHQPLAHWRKDESMVQGKMRPWFQTW